MRERQRKREHGTLIHTSSYMQKFNSKWKNEFRPTVELKTIKLPRENIGQKSF